MKDILKIGPIVASLIVGGVFILIGAVGVIPVYNQRIVIEESMRYLLILLGILMVIWGIWQGTVLVKMDALGLKGISTLPPKEIKPLASEIVEQILPTLTKLINPVVTPSLFIERQTHFLQEKIEIADQFTPILFKRIQYAIQHGKTVYLLIDSGTTIFPFFERIGKFTVQAYLGHKKWIESLSIETNNLPGVDKIMQVGRINPNNRFSPLAVKVNLLPGTPLPIYSALTGDRTVAEIKQLRQEAKGNAVFISIITGNFVRIRRTPPLCPIPLARGEGHPEFKQALVDCSDEIYLVATLGKVFFNVSLDEVNNSLGFSYNNPNLDKQSYKEVTIDDEKAHFVKLISTSRRQGRVLSSHCEGICALLDCSSFCDSAIDIFEKMPIEKIPHIFFPFDNLPDDWSLQVKTEFPHELTRNNKFMLKYFQVSIPSTITGNTKS